MINLTYAYLEKDSVFECGFHSFLGQNRTQFSVSFFIFGLLFLLFDLEILLVYPYSVSSYTNDIYGLVIMMVFFVLLTLGFIFELGKNALTIESRQTSFNNGEVSNPHAFTSLQLESNIFLSIIHGVILKIRLDVGRQIVNFIVNYISNAIIVRVKTHCFYPKCHRLIVELINLYTYCDKVTNLWLARVITIAKIRYPLLYMIFMVLYSEYSAIFSGNFHNRHVYILLFLGYYADNLEQFCSLALVMSLCCIARKYNDNHLASKYPYLTMFIDYLIKIVYLLCLTMTINLIFESIILPLVNKLIIALKGVFNGILKMAGPDKGNLDTGKSSGNSPTPNPKNTSNVSISDSKKNEDRESKKSRNKELKLFTKAIGKFKKAERRPGDH